jgi:hypothetical protein
MSENNVNKLIEETAANVVTRYKELSAEEVTLTKELDGVRAQRTALLGLIDGFEKTLGKSLIKRQKAKAGKTRSKKKGKAGKTRSKKKGKRGRPEGTKGGSGITNLIVEDLETNGPSSVKDVATRLVESGKLKETSNTSINQRIYSTITRLQKSNRIVRVDRGTYAAVTKTEPTVEEKEEVVVGELEGEVGIVQDLNSVNLIPGFTITEVVTDEVTPITEVTEVENEESDLDFDLLFSSLGAQENSVED